MAHFVISEADVNIGERGGSCADRRRLGKIEMRDVSCVLDCMVAVSLGSQAF